MTKSGWRTIIINNGAKIGYSYDQLVIKNDIEHIVPIEQIKTVMIDTTQTEISTKLIAELLQQYHDNVEIGDVSNREGQAARVYFNSLFGMNFRRRSENNINAALNYGYTVLLSTINQVVTLHGYHLGLGIKHCDKMNPFNLSCDIIEPFRPFVDKVVYKNGDRALDWSYKKELINISYKTVIYNGQKTELQTALDSFAFGLLENVSNMNYCLKEVEMVE